MKVTKLIENVIQGLPYPNQITDLEIINSGEPASIEFTWRSKRYRVCGSLRVESVDGVVLCGCDTSMLMEALLRLKEKA